MTKIKKIYLIFTALAVTIAMTCPKISGTQVYDNTAAQASSAHNLSPRDKILPPKGMVEGQLENGLQYAIMPNASPSRMIECRLIFKTGSMMETDGNRGAAHFLEHMAFGGTKHFPKRALVDYLESIGVQYGVGINAFTGYDRTIYMFSVPSDEPENLDNALLILKDWLTGITLAKKKVEGEKGIILEELRGYDIGDEFYDLKIGTGKYSEGIPLGTAEDIARISPEILRDFHDTWYTPDRAMVAIVGDIDPADVRQRIQKILGPIEANASPSFKTPDLEYAPGITIKSVKDTMARSTNLELIIPHKARMKTTLADAVEVERNHLLVRAISKRFYATGINASVSNNWYLVDKEHFVISVSGPDKESAEEKMHAALAEIHRIARDGLNDSELEELLKEARCRPWPSGNSSHICENIAESFLFGDRELQDEAQAAYVCSQVKATKSIDLQEILTAWLTMSEYTTLVAARYNPLETGTFTEEEIATLLTRAPKAELPPYIHEAREEEEERPRTEIPAFLLADRPAATGNIAARTYYKNIAVTDVLLENGFRIVLRPTHDEEKKIQLQISAPGGLSRVPEKDYAYYAGLAGYMELGGIEGMSDEDYYSIMAENGVGMLVAIESHWHGMIASAPVDNTRLMLNLLYQKMTNPGLNYEAFEDIRQEELEDLGKESYLTRLMKQDVQRQLNMQIDSLMGNLVYGRRTEVSRQDLETLTLDTLAVLYRELFTNPTGMTCVVCGDFDVDDFLAEAVPIFGSLPRGAEPNCMGPSHFTLPETTRKLEYPNANQTQTVFDYIRFGTYEPSLRSGLKLKLMNNLIRNRLLTVLREQESLVYSPYSSLFYNARPDKIFYIDINASVDRNNTTRVHEVLDSIIEELQRKKVSDNELNTLKKIFIVNKRTYLEDDATANWKNYLVKQLRNDETLVELDMYESVLESITAAELRDEFRRCFDTGRFMILSIGEF